MGEWERLLPFPHSPILPLSHSPIPSPDPPVQLAPAGELLEVSLVRRELERLLASQPQESEHRQAVIEQAVDPLLERAAEVDHHVPAEDDVELVERAVHG